MATSTIPSGAARGAPESLGELVDRFDPSAFDAPTGRARLRLSVADDGAFDAVYDRRRGLRLVQADLGARADALIEADGATWDGIAGDYADGMAAYGAGRLTVRHNLHLAIGFLAATSGSREEGRLRSVRVETAMGSISTLQAGTGDPLVMLHGLGATKASFMPTIAALAATRRTIAIDLPGFGDSVKPLGAAYHAPYFARSVVALLDALELERADVMGHSMGGRVAIDMGARHPDRTDRLILMTPSLAWKRARRFVPWVRLARPELGLFQPTSRRVAEALVRRLVPGADNAWVAAAVDEFLRSYLTARGRAAFYAAARRIYLEEPDGPNGFWMRLRELAPDALFIWGRHDGLVPLSFARHVREALPAARHVELNCGHVPQLERPAELHRAIDRFLAGHERAARRSA